MNKIEQAIEALEQVDRLIEHQFTGSRDAMTALQVACDDALKALSALRSIPGPATKEEIESAWVDAKVHHDKFYNFLDGFLAAERRILG